MVTFFDSSNTISHGWNTALGVVRVEHYVARALAMDASLDIHFVVFDTERKVYRELSGAERTLIETVVLHRYDNRGLDRGSAQCSPDASPGDSTRPRPATNVAGESVRQARARVIRLAQMSADQFGSSVTAYAARRLPITVEQSPIERVGKRVIRRLGLMAARRGHAGLRRAATQFRSGMDRVAAADSPTTAAPAKIVDDRPGECQLNPGDVLISVGNMWDYMDFGYLHRLCRHQGVKLIAVIHDVIVVELPFTSMLPAHIYHRFWVELAHLSSRLLAVSRQSAISYQHFIAEPNDLSVNITHAHLPNFLKEHASAIGEVAVVGLEGQNFVLFCSTIESRKNHQLLLHVWDHLRTELSADSLPILVFAGKWGWGVEHVRSFVERNWRLRRHLRVLDQVSDAELIWLYRNARFTVFPSFAEGFGLGAAESLSFGTPVIVSDHPALLEATEGLMPAHSAYDFEAWRAEIRRAATDDAHLVQLQTSARRYRGPTYDSFADAVKLLADQASRDDI